MKPTCFPILKLRELRVQFNGVVAVDLEGLDLFECSQLAALLGPNGAGKSTLINAVTGYAPVRPPGSIVLDNGKSVELTGAPRDEIVRAGVARTFQMPTVFSSLTVIESLMLAAVFAQPKPLPKRLAALFRAPERDGRAAILVEHLIQSLDLVSVSQDRMGTLPFVILRRAELARALALQPRILFLDEPSAGADVAETEFLTDFIAERLPSLISSLFAEGLYRFQDVAIGLVTHDRVLLAGLARSCAAPPVAYHFDQGKLIGSGPLDEWLNGKQPSSS